MEEERRRPAIQCSGASTNLGRSKPMNTKPFPITKLEVFAAWKRVRENKGAAGIDKVTISKFEANLGDNLYTLWNRMSSGSYFPEPVRRVEIPKADGKKRPLGIPTVKDRIAQDVVRARLEPVMEARFHQDSYGFRPGRSALDALEVCRQRCFKYDWVVDVDIEKFFDTIDHELLMKAVKKHCPEKWMHLYISRWLKAGAMKEGEIIETEKGTPQGGVISPLLANLFLHYGFDLWMQREHPANPFERYADDVVIHCRTQREAEAMKLHLEQRLGEVGLRLHPDKTLLVYCKDWKRRGNHENISFTFLGYTFRPRGARAKNRKVLFTGFLPAASTKAKKKLREKLKEIRIFRRTDQTVTKLAEQLNPIVRGWLNYFTVFYRSGVSDIIFEIDYKLTSWLMHKSRLKRTRAMRILAILRKEKPKLFTHWSYRTTQGRFARAV